jgi:serine protease AprX
MKKILIGIFSFVFTTMVFGQSATQKYWVYFTDKNNAQYSIDQPLAYLSESAIQRRAKMGISINYYDIPVNAEYVTAIKNLGVNVIVESRWLNAVSVESNAEQLTAIQTLPFVKNTADVKRYAIIDDSGIPIDDNILLRTTNYIESDYGGAYNQNHMIDIDFLHNLGYRGQGIKIAVLDGGFDGVNTGAGFSSLFNKNQIIETRNFPDNNEDVFFSSTHGSNVLSIMAVDNPGVYIGSAPDAQYYLFRTEVVDSERAIEEDYWLQAAEYADFIGADIINSSLGYTTFDTIIDDHTYEDMDGNTTVITKAADRAAAVGILVCNSAGNEGDGSWYYIGAPADGDSVFTIGAVDINGNSVSFSSHGPTFDGRLKPNIVGQGAGTGVVTSNGTVAYGNGTSYSSPLIAGACASFMSAFPELSNMEVMDIIQSTASQADNPDNSMGYGIPNFAKAYMELKGIDLSTENIISILPNPASDEVTIFINGQETGEATLYIYDISGKRVYETSVTLWDGKLAPVYISGLDALASGMYTVYLAGDVYQETQKMIVR